MPRGDQKARVIAKRQLSEPGYYAFASVVGQQRHFNVLTARLLAACGLEPLRLLDAVSQPAPPDLLEEQLLEWIIQECECPMTLLRTYVGVGGEQPDGSRSGRIAAGLRSTSEASLRRWGDKNHLSPPLLRRYTSAEGLPLDTQAELLSSDHDGEPLAPDELWDFIVAHPGGQHTYQPQSYGHRLAESFRRVAGFRLNWDYATTLLGLMQWPSETGEAAAPDDDDECPF
ncbi:MAG: hypothetical protein ACRYFX_08630 [Janthinobacterium lividum]